MLGGRGRVQVSGQPVRSPVSFRSYRSLLAKPQPWSGRGSLPALAADGHRSSEGQEGRRRAAELADRRDAARPLAVLLPGTFDSQAWHQRGSTATASLRGTAGE